MVQTSYLLRKPDPPSAASVFFDQRIMPKLINGAGAVETSLECLASATRAAPARVLTAGLVAGFVLGSLYARQKRRE